MDVDVGGPILKTCENSLLNLKNYAPIGTKPQLIVNPLAAV